MTRNKAAAEYRRLRAIFITRQRAMCTIYGSRATVETFDTDAARYLNDVCGYDRTPANFVYAARAMLTKLMSDDEATNA